MDSSDRNSAPGLDLQLRATELFKPGAPPIHINMPRHEGHTPLHDHDFYEIALVTRGKALHRDVHGLTPIAAGCLILVQPGQWHAYEHGLDLQLINLVFGRELVGDALRWCVVDGSLSRLLAPSSSIRLIHGDPGEQQLLRRQLKDLAKDLSHHSPARVRAVAGLLHCLQSVHELLPQARSHRRPEEMLSPRLQTCLQHMEDALAHDWSLQELASLADCDASYLNRLFRRHLGTSPIAWLHRRRCERAAIRLLTTDEAIASIGTSVGWPDANYFSRRFRAMFGQSPRAYRGQLPLPAGRPLIEDWVQW